MEIMTTVSFKVLCSECETQMVCEFDEDTMYVWPCPNGCKDSEENEIAGKEDGINPEGIPELVRAAEKCIDMREVYHDDYVSLRVAVDEMEAALAKVKP